MQVFVKKSTLSIVKWTDHGRHIYLYTHSITKFSMKFLAWQMENDA